MTLEIPFSKYHGAGNDFIAVDNTLSKLNFTSAQISAMCKRKTGIGADGVLEIRQPDHPSSCFKLIYYNADGKEGSLCGNGSRCSLAFARKLNLTGTKGQGQQIHFEACDGIHSGGWIEEDYYFITMRDVFISNIVTYDENNYFINTGSPHHVRFVNQLLHVDVVNEGKELRWSLYGLDGSNINFVEVDKTSEECDLKLKVRTFERGVEDETLSCGTGAVASAIAAFLRSNVCGERSDSTSGGSDARQVAVSLSTPGGLLNVSYRYHRNLFSIVQLAGQVKHIFDGLMIKNSLNPADDTLTSSPTP